MSAKLLVRQSTSMHLSWKSNTENICRKITSGISALRRLRDFVDRQTLLSVYNAIVRPYFDYCCEVWDVFGETQSKRLQKLQNRAARIIMNMSNDTDHSVALQALGWKTLCLLTLYNQESRNVWYTDN